MKSNQRHKIKTVGTYNSSQSCRLFLYFMGDAATC
jgi:hypothetical protein